MCRGLEGISVGARLAKAFAFLSFGISVLEALLVLGIFQHIKYFQIAKDTIATSQEIQVISKETLHSD